MIRAALVAGLVLAAAPACCRTLAELEAGGYLVRQFLAVDGDFHGCDRLHPIRLAGGADFVCDGASFTYLHDPVAIVLRNPATLETVLSIGGVEYAGRLEGTRLGRRIETGPPLGPGQADPASLQPDAPTNAIRADTGLDAVRY